MVKAPQTPALADLRKEIDRIDEAMHQLLMERGEIIDRLIAVKRTQDTGTSAFRPAREAEMMRRLVKRHKGILPVDTAESIWRVIISTFTYVQSPFSVHADLSAGDALMRDSARFHFGFTVPFVPHMGAAGVVAAVSDSKGDLGLVPASDVASVKEINEPRLPSFKAKLKAKKEAIPVWGVADLNLPGDAVGLAGSFTQVVKVFPPPPRGESQTWEGDPADLAARVWGRLKELGRR